MDFQPLEEYLNHLPEFGIPAADIAVYKDHQCVFRHMAGHSDHTGKVPVAREDLYNLYSNTKPVTVVAVMQLVEQGKLNLADPVSKFLPAYETMYYKTPTGDIEKAKTPITVYHLLTMTAGMGYDPVPTVEEFLKNQGRKATTVEVVNALAQEPLCFEPGTRWKYGRCLDVLAAVIEVVTGLKFSEYMKQNIFAPLGMEHTTFNEDDAYTKAHLSGFYTYDSKNRTAIPAENLGAITFLDVKGFESGGAGLISSTDDYARFLDVLANDGVSKDGYRLLSEESIRQIRTPRLDLLQQSQYILSHYKRGYGYGLGVRTLIDKGFGARSPLGEFGWDGMTGGYGLVDTENRLAVCYMQNVYGCDYAWHVVFPETRDMLYDILKIGG